MQNVKILGQDHTFASHACFFPELTCDNHEIKYDFTLCFFLQVSFTGEGSAQRGNSYNAQRQTTPSQGGAAPPIANGTPTVGTVGTVGPRKPSCDPSTMNGNGPPRLRPPPPGQGRASSIDPVNRPPGAPPRTRASRTPMNPEEMAARGREVEARQAQQSFQRDCFIIPQESVERFLPDGITVSPILTIFRRFFARPHSFWPES